MLLYCRCYSILLHLQTLLAIAIFVNKKKYQKAALYLKFLIRQTIKV